MRRRYAALAAAGALAVGLSATTLVGGGTASADPTALPGYEVVHAYQQINSSVDQAVEAWCPTGKIGLGGGGVVPGQPSSVGWALTYSVPETYEGGVVGWTVQAHRFGAESDVLASVSAYIICVDGS
jgi:hypothetical protein